MTDITHPPYSQVSPGMAKPSIPSISQSAPTTFGNLPPLPAPPYPIRVSEWSSSGWAHSGEQLHAYGDKCYRAGMAYARSAGTPAANAVHLGEREAFEGWIAAALRKTYPHMHDDSLGRKLWKHGDGDYMDLQTQHVGLCGKRHALTDLPLRTQAVCRIMSFAKRSTRCVTLPSNFTPTAACANASLA